MRFIIILLLALPALAGAAVPTDKLDDQMNKILAPLHTPDGWKNFIQLHPQLFGHIDAKANPSFLGVEDVSVTVDGENYKVGMGCRSVYVAATPKTVVGIVNDPRFFQSMYGLDKPADVYPANSDGTFKARIFKLVPGIETQDYTLNYTGDWQKDGSWIGQSRQVHDERGFALRNNIKIVEPYGTGSVYREVALLYPRRWWMRLLHGIAQSVFESELGKLNKSLKCVAEKVQNGRPMSDDIAKACYKESRR